MKPDMKKRLLKPPEHNNEILFLPEPGELLDSISEGDVLGTCHQPGFFNPGVVLKFLFLELLPVKNKKILFLDTDKTKAFCRIPRESGTGTAVLASSENPLIDYPMPERKKVKKFLDRIERLLDRAENSGIRDLKPHFQRFREIFSEKSGNRLLKHSLAESFLEYFGISRNYGFVSDLLQNKDYLEFVKNIFDNHDRFRKDFNLALKDYEEEFRFRFKNYPFPPLEENELPFWIVRDEKRKRLYKNDIDRNDIDRTPILPRAVTLTLFLRMYYTDFFIHGIGGGNYEWIGDRLIQTFYNQKPRPYVVISGTFLKHNVEERNLPWFLFSPERLIESAKKYLNNAGVSCNSFRNLT